MIGSIVSRLLIAFAVLLLTFISATQSVVSLFMIQSAFAGSSMPAAELAQAGQAVSNLVPLDARGQRLYIVRLTEPALASYTGGIRGLQPTSPRATGATRLDVNSAASRAYLDLLASRQNDVLADVASRLNRQVEPEFQYLNVLNAMALRLSPNEAAELEGMSGVRSVMPDRLAEIETDVGPIRIGAPAIWQGDTLPGDDTRGEGVIVGIIDTGINSQNPSFAATDGFGYTHTNPYGADNYVGWCVGNQSFCNSKLIGAHNFHPNGGSPEDTNGHGSHTGGTAAGNRIMAEITQGPSVFNVEISGVAPRANVIAYKVCDPGCPSTSSVAAVNQAISDGVDVLNYSISGSDNPWNDSTDQAFLDAFNANIFVAASAGNAGPSPSTVAKTGPWNAAVGASTHNRVFANILNLDGGPQDVPAVQGEGPAIISDYTGPLRWAGDVNADNFEGCSSFPAGSFAGQAALISRGSCTFATKVNNAVTAGAEFVVVYNIVGGPAVVMGGLGDTTVSSVMTDDANGAALIATLGGATSPVTVLEAVDIFIDNNFADVMGGFSSRGPSQFDLLAPTFVAPGVNILAAGASSGGDPDQWYQSQGTSMSSPHAAGAGALIRGLYPTWTPAEIRSVLALGANPNVLSKENGVTPADPFDQGSGLLNLDATGRGSLVMDETGANFAAANPATGGDPRTLNVPHMVDQDCVGSCSWTRTVTNAGTETRSYDASGTGPAGMTITVTPSSFTLATDQSQALTIDIDIDGDLLEFDNWAFAEIQIVPQENAPIDFVEVGEAYDFNGTWTARTHDISTLAGQEVCLAFRLEGTDTHAWYIDDIQVTSDAGSHLNQSFTDETFPPAGWSVYQLGTTPQREWARATASFNSGPAAAWHNWNGEAFHDDSWLVTPKFTLGTNPALNYFDRMTFIGFYRYSGVWASTGNCDPTVYPEASTARLPVAIIPINPDPVISISPDNLAVTLPADQGTSETLMISNLGGVDLNWNIDDSLRSSVMLDLTESRSLPPVKAELDPRLATAQPVTENVDRQLQRFQATTRAGEPFELVLDDGVGENALGLTGGGQFLWFNRFTPSPLDFPLTLEQVQVMFGYPGSTGGINVGELVDIYLFEDADGDPTNGATHLASLNDQAVQVVDGVTWSTFALAEPVDFTGPGDILVAVVNRTAGITTGTFPAVVDQSPPSQGRSWIGLGEVPEDPPQMPMPTFGVIDSFVLAGNWMVRAQGVSNGPCVSLEEVPWLSVNPASGVTARDATSLVTIGFNSAGLDTGIHEAVLCVNSDDPNAPLIGLPVSLEVIEAPVIATSVDQVVIDVLSDGSSSVDFEILNVGQLDLIWSIDTDQPRAGNGPEMLFDTGPLITSTGNGPEGSDVSLLQSVSLGMTTLGASANLSGGGPHFRIADDFSVTGTNIWQIDTIRFYAYQTDSSTDSSFTGVNFQIWDGVPGEPTSSVVFGDTTTNRIMATDWTGAYRYAENNVGNTQRPIMYIDAEADVWLQPGNYWIDWQLAGSIASGPWQPPVTRLGETITGNARQLVSAGWQPFVDGGTADPQGAPFQLHGVVICESYSSVPWLSVTPTSGTTPAGGNDAVTVSVDATGLAVPSSHSAYICIESNDPTNPVWPLPVWLNVVVDEIYQDRFEQ